MRVRSRESAYLAWLDEFLSPWFSPVSGGSPSDHEAIVTLRSDPERKRRLLAASPPPESASRIDGFILDSRVVSHAVWRERDSERLIFDEELDVFYRVSRRHPHVRILGGTDQVATRVALMRVVRELAMAHGRRAGRLLLHAAALEIGGRAIAVIGPKQAGKTSLLLHLLRAPNARFLANDRVFVDLGASPPQLLGLPSIVALRPGTLSLFPELEARAAESGYAFWQTFAESRAVKERRPATAGNDVTPAQLCDLVRVEATVSAPLGALIFPQPDQMRESRGPGVDLERLPQETVERRLRDNLFGGPNGGRRSAAFGASFGPAEDESISPAALCTLLARAVPAFDYGRRAGALAEPQAAAALADWLAVMG